MNEVRTITTNKTSADLMGGDFTQALAKQIAASQKSMVQQLMDDTFGKPSNDVEKLGDVQRRVDQVKTHKKMVSYPNGYWAKLEIDANDHVTYKVFNSGWLAKTFNKVGFRKVLGTGWDAVKQRDKVEATLGATYMAIDEAIEFDLKQVKHSKFLKEMIKTDPDNLKAIAQLDMLDKGDGPGAAVEPVLSATGVSAAQVGNATNIKVAGAGSYYSKIDPNKPASISVGPIDLNSGGSHSITFGSGGEEALKVDPDGEVTFGNKMAEAIKKAVNEKGDVHES